MHRRKLLKTSATLLAGAALGGSRWVEGQAAAMLNDHADIPRTNWSKNFHYNTDRVYAPADAGEVQAIVRQAAKLKPLGSRHCFNDIADTTAAQISMLKLDRIQVDAVAKTATVGAGVRYGTLAPVIDAQGFALHNLASLPHITVGGSIATATHGSGERNGNLATEVVGLEIVKADGRLVHLSRSADGAIFDEAVVHLGALGVVTAVTLKLVPTFDMTQTVYEHLSFDQLEHHLDAIMGAAYSVSLFTHWQDHRATQVWIKSKVEAGTTPPAFAALPKQFYGATLQSAKLHPVGGVPAENCTDQMGSVGRWYERLPHFKMGFTPSSGNEIQTEYFVPRARAYEAILAVETLRDSITPHLLVTELRTIAADDLPMSMAYRRDSLAIHFTWKPDAAAVLAVLPQIEAKLAPFAARPHWGKVFTMQGKAIAAAYPKGAGPVAFREVAGRMDPDGKFRNAYLERDVFSA